MFKIIDQLNNSTEITEWVDPWDTRLERATGQPAPQKGGVDRIGWEVESKDWSELVSAIKRLIVPTALAEVVSVTFDGDEDWNRLLISAQSEEDWSQCFPTNHLTNIMTVRGLKRWAAVAITDTEVGLGIFAEQTIGNNVLARIQNIPNETVRGIIG